MKAMMFVVSVVLPSMATGQTIHQFDEHIASSIVDLGDLDHDGAADFAVAFHNGSLVRIYSGATATAIHQIGFNAGGAPPPIDSADFDNDGEIDLLAGAWSGGNSSEGQVLVIDHATGGTLLTVMGTGANFRLGRSVAVAGDANIDGFVDFVAGASDRAYVYSGATGLLLHSWNEPIGDYGYSVGGGHDVDADGLDDVVVGNPGFVGTGGPAQGKAIVYTSANFSELIPLEGTTINERLGEVVQLAPDLNGDVYADALILSKTKSTNQLPGGTLHMVRGPFGFPVPWSVSAQSGIGPRPFDVTPDWDNDGLPDVLVAGISSAKLISGKTGAELSVFELPVTGAGLAEIGDVNGDGASDAAAATGTQVIVFSHVCGSIQNYGSGCVGFGGATPVLTLQGCGIALTPLQVSITNAVGPSAAMILIGTGRASIPISPSCSLLVGGLLPGGIKLPLTGNSMPGSGHAGFVVEVPTAAVGTTATLQAFIFDTSMPTGYSATQGVEVKFY